MKVIGMDGVLHVECDGGKTCQCRCLEEYPYAVLMVVTELDSVARKLLWIALEYFGGRGEPLLWCRVDPARAQAWDEAVRKG